MNALNDFDKTDLEYSLPLTDDLIRGQRWWSQQAVSVAKALLSMMGHQNQFS